MSIQLVPTYIVSGMLHEFQYNFTNKYKFDFEDFV